MKRLFAMTAVLLSFLLLTACGNGSVPFQDSSTFSSPYGAYTVIFRNHSSLLTGLNSSGQLGDGTTNSYTSFRWNYPAFRPEGIATGSAHTVAFATPVLGNYSSVYCWGSNGYGQLGTNPSSTSYTGTPVKVGGFGGQVTAVAAGGSHSMALTAGGLVWAWGNNASGQLGFNNITTLRYRPTQVAGLPTAAKIAAGAGYSIAIDAAGTVWAWGDNSNRQLGFSNITTPYRYQPRQVPLISGVGQLAAGGSHVLVLIGTDVYAWGYNGYGELGDGTQLDRATPQKVVFPTPTAVVAIAAGAAHSVAIDAMGNVWTWGYNLGDQLGYDTVAKSYQLTPKMISLDSNGTPFTGIAQIVFIGGNHTIVRKTDGSYWAWGYNGYGQLGINTYNNQPAPVKITLP